MPNPTDEALRGGLSPRQQVLRIARCKLENAVALHGHRQLPLLTADTLLAFRGKAIGKQESEAQALKTLRRLAGAEHEVLTACCLAFPDRRPISVLAISRVRFLPWDETLYHGYLATGEWNDAAGGYRIQETGWKLVEALAGSWSNVMGLPLPEVYGMISGYLSSRGVSASGPR